MPFIDFARHIDLDDLFVRFRECTPHLLVVADGSLSAGPGAFGLNGFVDVLENTSIHGMKPIVTTRHRSDGQVFDDLSIGRFDVLFLFGFDGVGNRLGNSDIDRIATFMQAGGGVFATGDHDDLGAGMCGQIPRVRHMRFWEPADTPDQTDATRLSTNLPGDDRVFRFGDQSDEHPQRLYANYAIASDYPIFVPVPIPTNLHIRQPHPLLRLADGSALDVYPDHPHEGECRLPDDLGTDFQLDGESVAEWPGAGGFPFPFAFPAPRHVASTMSYGNGFTDFGLRKQPLVPRAFIAIAAYNGQAAGVGRVVTDATWHHYVNTNFAGLAGTADEDRIHDFWSNLANWLMPVKTRKCLFPWVVAWLLIEHPVAEELRIPDRGRLEPPELIRIGSLFARALDEAAGSVGEELLADVVGTLVDRDRLRELMKKRAPEDLRLDGAAQGVVLAALGSAVVDIVRLAATKGLDRDDDLFDRLIGKSAKRARRTLEAHRVSLEREMESAAMLDKALIG